MRIVHINRSDTTGGAAVAAMRLVRALNASNMESQLLVAEKKSQAPWVHSVADSRFGKVLLWFRFLREVLFYFPHEKKKAFRFAWSAGQSGFDISKHPLVVNADIIHLHWINQGFISIKDLNKLFKLGKPVVWTLHDMWSFTGGCHYSGACDHFEHQCGGCPFLNDAHANDLSHDQHRKKLAIYAHANLSIVTCSHWLSHLASRASLFQGKKVLSIPNPIETTVYHPKSQEEARSGLNLPLHKKIILFGAANIADPRKGMTLLMAALDHLAKKHTPDQIELVVFGKVPEGFTEKFPFPVQLLNYINEEKILIDLYNAADVFVLPSLEDNLPNTVMEALACGLPVAAFRIGGVPEMVIQGANGFLSTPGDSISLADSIDQLLFNPPSNLYRANAREKAEQSYAPGLIAKKYTDLYQSLLNQEPNSGKKY
jgi:glycosyltransferase involved in cell wall biosynthesis